MHFRPSTGFALVMIALAAPSVSATTYVVNQVGDSFVPSPINIGIGDTVQWVHSSGVHTITSGSGPTDPHVGALFDVPFNSGTFSHTFTTAGDVPYFCRLHFAMGMTGVVHVATPSAVEPTEWARVKALYR